MRTAPHRAICLPSWAALAALLSAACATYQSPLPLDQMTFRERAKVSETEKLRVSVAVLDARESRAAFGVDLASKKIQPVWLEVVNKTGHDYFFFPAAMDPDYYSPLEVAYICRVSGKDDNRRMAAHFDGTHMPIRVPPRSSTSGFVFTNLDEGIKYVQVELLGDAGLEHFAFLPDIAGTTFDWQTVDFDALYPDGISNLQLSGLRQALESLPCCTTDKAGSKSGDPMNLVIVGELQEILRAMARRGWDPTHMLNFKVAAKTAGAFLFASHYRYSPVSPLYVYGRPQDLALQKPRRTIHQRNHLRLWLAPFRHGEREVWVGQISRDIGIRHTLKAPFATTHKIDPDVDEARDYLMQDLLISEFVGSVGAVAGVGARTADAPARNLTGDPWYSDGLRIVLFLQMEPTPIDEVEFLPWEIPARLSPTAPAPPATSGEKLSAQD
jgi:hypothetical protein